jgi:Flp pilus assembly protein CpaB
VSSRRTLILIGAIVIGGLAAFLTLNYVKGVESDSAEENQLVEVLVAAGPIAKGASADEAIANKVIAPAKRRRADLPANVVTRDAEISGQVAAVGLGGGEIVTSMMFVADNALSGSKGTSLDKGNVAITFSADGAAGVAGLIQPGDSINIMIKGSVAEGDGAASADAASGASHPGAGEGEWVLGSPYVYSFQDVKVLAVGTNLGEPVAASTTPPADGAAAPAAAAPSSGLITVQLPPDKAILLASVKDSGLYLTLNRPDYEPTPQPFFNLVPALPGELGVSPYPDQPAGTDGQ